MAKVRITYTVQKTHEFEGADSLCDLGHAIKRLQKQVKEEGSTWVRYSWEVVKKG